MNNAHQAIEFIEAVYKLQHLRQEFGRVYDAIEFLSTNLDIRGRQSLLGNMRLYMGRLAAEVDDTQNVVNTLLPEARAYRQILAAAEQSGSDERQLPLFPLDKVNEPKHAPIEEKETNSLPDAVEPEPEPSASYCARPVFGDWDDEKPSDGNLRPSYDDLQDDDAQPWQLDSTIDSKKDTGTVQA